MEELLFGILNHGFIFGILGAGIASAVAGAAGGGVLGALAGAAGTAIGVGVDQIASNLMQPDPVAPPEPETARTPIDMGGGPSTPTRPYYAQSTLAPRFRFETDASSFAVRNMYSPR